MPTTGYSFLVTDKRHVIVDSNGSNVTAIIGGDAAADLDSINATLTTWQPDIAGNTANIDTNTTNIFNRTAFLIDINNKLAGVLETNTLRNPTTDVQSGVVVGSSGTFTSNTIDMDGHSKLTIMGSSTNTNDQLRIQYSVDDATYYIDNTMITVDFSSGDYAKVIDTGGARYVQIIQIDTQTTSFTMNFSSSIR